MKSISIILFFFFSFLSSFAQPIQQKLSGSSPSTETFTQGFLSSDSGYRFRYAFQDTIQANYGYLKNQAGLQIRVNNQIYQRSDCLCEWLLQTSPPINVGNYLVSVFNITTVDSTVTYFAPIVYVQNGVTQTKATNQAFTVNTVTSGYNRTDVVYIDSVGVFRITTGQSDTTLTSPPVIPANGILVGYININGSVVTAAPPATGVNYWTQGGDTTLNPVFGSKNDINVTVIRNNVPQYYLEPTRIRSVNSILMDTARGQPLNDRNSTGLYFRAGNSLNQTMIVGVDGSTGGSTGGKGFLLNSGSFGVLGTGQFETNYPTFSYQDVSGIDHQNLGLFKVRNSSTAQSGNVFNITKHNSANSPKPLVNVGYNAVTVIQDSINGAAASSAILDVRSTSKGILIPRMTGAQMNAIATPTTGTLVQCIDSSNSPFCYYTGSGWRKLLSATGGNATFTGVTDVIVDTLTNTICVITTTATNCYPLSGDSVRVVGDTSICVYTNGSPDCYESNGDTLIVSGGIDSFTVIGNVACAWDNGSSICFNINNSNGYVDNAVLASDSSSYDFYSGSTYLFSLPTLLRGLVAGTGIYIADTTIDGKDYTIITNTGGSGGGTLQDAFNAAPDDPQLNIGTNAFTFYNVPEFNIIGQTGVAPILTLKSGATDEGGFLEFKDNAGSDILELRGSITNGNQLGSIGSLSLTTFNNFPLKLLTDNTERLRIDENGNVGIGTTSPTAKLHVNTGAVLFDSMSTITERLLSGGNLFDGRTVDANGTTSFTVNNGTNSYKAVEIAGWGSNPLVIQTNNGDGQGTFVSAEFRNTGGASFQTTTGSAILENLTWSEKGALTIRSSNTADNGGVERLFIAGSTDDTRISIGHTSPDASSILDIQSTVSGFLPPRMTTTQKNAIGTPAVGLMVFDTDLDKLCVYTTTNGWEIITSAP